LRALQRMKPQEGLDELVWAFVYRLGPRSRDQMVQEVGSAGREMDEALERLVEDARIEKDITSGGATYRCSRLFIPVDAPVGWEAAVFDHFKAMVNTVSARLSDETQAGTERRVGGSTYTLDIWQGHPFAEEAMNTLARVRTQLSAQREKIEAYNAEHGIPQ